MTYFIGKKQKVLDILLDLLLRPVVQVLLLLTAQWSLVQSEVSPMGYSSLLH